MSDKLKVPDALMAEVNALLSENKEVIEELSQEPVQKELVAPELDIPDDMPIELSEPEVDPEAGNLEVVAEEEDKPRDYTDVELKAMKMGWKPRDQFKDAPDDFVEAEHYIDRGPFIKQINEQKEALRQLAATVAAAEERGRQKALQELLAQKQLAYQQGNYSKANELENQQMEMLQAEKPPVLDAAAPSLTIEDVTSTAEWVQFASENEWVGSNKAEHVVLRDKAGAAVDKYLDIVGHANLTKEHVPELLKYVKNSISPEIKPNTQAPRAPAVLTSKGKASDTKSRRQSAVWNKLSPAEKMVAKECCLGDNKTMEFNEYIDQLIKNGRTELQK